MCGDHARHSVMEEYSMGSPPHVRGPRSGIGSCYIMRGITPACAGTTVKCCNFRYSRWDHPRMCGDHVVVSAHATSCEGSPPHVRGPRLNAVISATQGGITPACAGTTEVLLRVLGYDRDHPRMCGDH